MRTSEDLVARREAVTPRGIPMATRTAIVSGNGALLIDVEGGELIDFAGGIGVMNVGHTTVARQTCFSVA